MAITKIPNSDGVPQDQKITLSIDNGDLKGLNEVIEQYDFKDEEAAIRFSLLVLLKAEDNAVWIKENGVPTRYVPTDKQLKPKE
jgi:hypothetical protein